MSNKKPDNVVFNSDNNTYDAHLKPYATSVGAPVITVEDTVAWKNRSVNKVNHKIKSKFLELKAEYDKMLEEYEYNKLILSSKFSFEPIIGEQYHLYINSKKENFLSLIAPNECNFDCLGSFYLDSGLIWKKIEE